MNININLKINDFEGPLDILLHLIKKNEMDIYDIKIFDITNQYLDVLKKMKELDLEIASEFVIMAATLLEIKSKTLLPKSKNEEEDDDSNDPRKQLIERLIEYKKYKAVAAHLRSLEGRFSNSYTKRPEIIDDKKDQFSNGLKDLDLNRLYSLYIKLIENYNEKMNPVEKLQNHIPVDTYKVEDKIQYLMSYSSIGEQYRFSHILKGCKCKIEMVVTFLALLELIKQKSFKVLQTNNYGEIFLERIN